VIGDLADIQAASLADIRNFFRTYYGPQNAALAIVGDFDPRVAKKLVEKYFATLPRGPDVKPPEVPQAEIPGVAKERFDDKLAEEPRLMLAWKGVRVFTDEEPAGDILADVLGTGKTSRLYKALVFERQLASGVGVSDATFGIAGWFQINLTASHGHQIAELEPVVRQILAEVKKNGVTADEVERAKRKIIANRLRTMERIDVRAELLDEYETFLGDPGFLPRDLARYRAVTPEAVQAFANKYLVDDHMIEIDVEPAAKRRAAGGPASSPRPPASGQSTGGAR
jgi:predicted Zn-dependent peptidase